MGRIIKNNGIPQGFTTMLNTHFMDKRLSWGAVGLLSNVLSLPDNWEFSTNGFKGMHSDGERAVRTAIFELEWFGYLKRHQLRNSKGTILDYDYEFYNISQLPDFKELLPKWKDRGSLNLKPTIVIIQDEELAQRPDLKTISDKNINKNNPQLQNVDMGNADVENADVENADVENDIQLSTNLLSTNLLSTNLLNTNQYQYQNNIGADNDNDFNISINESYIKDKLGYTSFQGSILDKTFIDDIINILLTEVYCITDKTKKFNLGTKDQPDFKSISIIKKIFDNELNFATISSYLLQVKTYGQPISNPINYHIKGLYKQCIESRCKYQSSIGYM